MSQNVPLPPPRAPLKLARQKPPAPDVNAPYVKRVATSSPRLGAVEETEAEEVVGSIDSILNRTREARDRWTERQEAAMKAREAAVREQEREIERRLEEILARETALIEGERELRETDMLLKARETVVTQREKRLKASGGTRPGAPNPEHEAKAKTLEHWEADLRTQAEELERYEKALAAREAEQMVSSLGAEGPPSGAASIAPVQAGETARAAEAWTDRARELDEREALLAERERFIEESENTLFAKAQELQELEVEFAHLRESDPGRP